MEDKFNFYSFLSGCGEDDELPQQVGVTRPIISCLDGYKVDSALLRILDKVVCLKYKGIPCILCNSIELFKECLRVFSGGGYEIYLNSSNSNDIDIFSDVVLDDGGKYKLYIVSDTCCPFDTFEENGKVVKVDRSFGVLIDDDLYKQICNVVKKEYSLKNSYIPKDSLFDKNFKSTSKEGYLEHMKTNYAGYVSCRVRDLRLEVDSITENILRLTEELAILVNKKNNVVSDIEDFIAKASEVGGLDSYIHVDMKLEL